MYFILYGTRPIMVEDMMNGSVIAKSKSTEGDIVVYYYKKCLQGQVYRQAENDCQGTGSESDNYGAVQLQYCDKADNSCNGGKDYVTLNGSGSSEAYDSCNSDTLLNRKWKVSNSFGEIFDSPYKNTIYSHIVYKGLKIWSSYSGASKVAKYVEPQIYSDYANKTNRLYVLCSSDE